MASTSALSVVLTFFLECAELLRLFVKYFNTVSFLHKFFGFYRKLFYHLSSPRLLLQILYCYFI